jgi:hypothetical protein
MSETVSLPKPRCWHTIAGMIATVIYLIGITAVVWGKRDTLPALTLNELGDFTAGAFSPLAFLWLVVGYLQQGEELRQNTAALELQAAELKASVDEQKALVEISRDQLEHAQEAYRLARKQDEISKSATFRLIEYGYATESPGRIKSQWRLRNVGYDALELRVRYADSNLAAWNETKAIDAVRSGLHASIALVDDIQNPKIGAVAVEYRDGTGFKKRTTWMLKMDGRLKSLTGRTGATTILDEELDQDS